MARVRRPFATLARSLLYCGGMKYALPSTLKLLLALPLFASLTACPPPGQNGTVPTTSVSDELNDPRAQAPLLGGTDPGAGLPDVEAIACRTTTRTVYSSDTTETLTYSEDTAGHPVSRVRDFNGRRLAEDRFGLEGGRLARIDSTYQDLESSTTFRYDTAGHVIEAVHEDALDAVATFTYTWEGDRLVEMAAVERYEGVDATTTWGIAYDHDDEGRLVRKRLTHGGVPSLRVEYDYDAAGHLVVKRYIGTNETAAPIEDVYTWEGDRLMAIERAITGETTRYTYTDDHTLTAIESVRRDPENPAVERVLSTVDVEVDCLADATGTE